MNKKYIIIICLIFNSMQIHAKKGIFWKLMRNSAAGYIAYQTHTHIPDKVADQVDDYFGIKYLMWRRPNLKYDEAKTIYKQQYEQAFEKISGQKHTTFVKIILTIITFEVSKAILDDYVYESLMA